MAASFRTSGRLWPAAFLAVALGLPAGPGTALAQSSYTWTQATSNVWTVATNWTPNRTVPAATDFLIIDGSKVPAPTLTSVPTETIGQLVVMNGVNATLQAAASGNTLTISGGAGVDLNVQAGSTLNISGANALLITLAAGTTGTVGGAVTVANAAHQLQANDAGALVFLSGGSMTTQAGFTGNVFGTTSLNSVVFQSASSYIHNAGANPFGASAPGSVVTFQPNSTAFYRTSSGFSASGRTYANLTIQNGTAISSSGSGDFQFQTLYTESGSSFSHSGSGAARITVTGDILSAGTGNITIAAGTGGFLFNGGVVQTVGAGGGSGGIYLNGSGTVSSATTLTLTARTLSISGGTLTVNGKLRLDPGGSVTASGDFVYGPGSELTFNNTSPLAVYSGLVYWPPAGPTNVTVQGSGGVTMNTSRTVSGTFTNYSMTTINEPATLTLNGPSQNMGSMVVNDGGGGGGTLAVGGTYNNPGTTTVSGNFQLNQGGVVTGNYLNYSGGAASTLVFNYTSSSYTVGTADPCWPSGNTPYNVEVIGAGGVTLNGIRGISGTFTANGPVTLGSGSRLMLAGVTSTNTSALQVNTGAVLALAGGFTNSGTVYISGTLELASAAAPTGMTFGYGPTGRLIFTGSIFMVTGDPYWPAAGGPPSVTAQGGISMQVSRTVDGLFETYGTTMVNDGITLTLNGPSTVYGTILVNDGSTGGTLAMGGALANNGTVTVNGTFQLNQGGSVSGNSITYSGSLATLAFNHSGGSYLVDSACRYWPTGMAPSNVKILGGGTVDLNSSRYVQGLFSTTSTVRVNDVVLELHSSSIGSAGLLAVQGIGTLALDATLSNGGGVTISPPGTIELNQGGLVTGNNVTYPGGGGGILVFDNSSGSYNLAPGSDAVWPAGVGPGRVRVLGSGGITLNESRTLNGQLEVIAGPVQILDPNVLTVSGSITTSGGGSITTVGGGTGSARLAVGGPVSNSGGLTINARLSIENAYLTFSGNSVAYGPTGSLVFNNPTGTYNVASDDKAWPTSSGPATVTVAGAGGITLGGRGYNGSFAVSGGPVTVTDGLSLNGPTQVDAPGSLVVNSGGSLLVIGTLTNNNTVRCDGGLVVAGLVQGGTAVTINADCFLQTGGQFNTVPTYGSTSRLHYTVSRTVGNEWTYSTGGTGPGPGVPGNVCVEGGTISMPATDRRCPGDLYLSFGTLAMDGGNLYVGGNWQQPAGGSGFTPGTSTVCFDGTSPQLLQHSTVPTTFHSLKMANATGLTLQTDVTVSQVLSLSAGRLTTGSNQVSVAPGGLVLAAPGSYVNGNLVRGINPGTTSLTFDIGDATNYTPVKLDFGSVTAPGTIRVCTTPVDHPQLGSSNISGGRSVNRYWSLTNSGVVFDNYAATFNFVPGDVDGGASPANFIVGRYSGGWSYPAVGSRTSTSTQATGLTAMSDFALGEPGTWTITASAGSHGSITPSGAIIVPNGGSQSFTIGPDDCHHIADVLVDGGSVGPVPTYEFTNVTSDHTIAASFALNTHVIAASAGAGGDISPSGAITVNCGDDQSFTISPHLGYLISDVLVDGGSVGAVTSYTFHHVVAGHTIAASFYGVDMVGPVATGCISTATPCVAVPVEINRTLSTPLRAFSVDVQLSGNLAICGAGIVEGSYLRGIGETTFLVVPQGGGLYTVDCAILGLPCGATDPAGTLFTLNLGSSEPSGTGTITVTAVTLRDCSNGTVAGCPGPPVSINIDNELPAAITDLAAAQVKSGNDSDGTTKITLTFTPPGDAAAVEVYRAGFGHYPEYDDAGGAAPAAPSYPPGAPWTLTGVTASGQADEPAERDFWYYAAFSRDACGNVSAVSNRTGGTLNYHLGDVHNGLADCAGNNLVGTEDLSFLGAHYGISLILDDPSNCLDVGPTSDFSVDARPLTDNVINFEDLMVFAINHGTVSKPGPAVGPEPVAADELTLQVPAVPAGDGTFDAVLRLSGAGDIQGLSVDLAFNPEAVEPGEATGGELLARQSRSSTVLSSRPGSVDVVLLGVETGLTGSGELARVTFRVIGPGEPGIGLAGISARDRWNHPVEVARRQERIGVPKIPAVTWLGPNYPNPFQRSTVIPLGLREPGRARLAIFDVQGRRVRGLLDAELPAGDRILTWDGRDDGGAPLASGLYVIRLEANGGVLTSPVRLVK